MPPLFESLNITPFRPKPTVSRFNRWGQPLGRQWYLWLNRLHHHWRQRPAWLRDPLVIIAGLWGGCCLWNLGVALLIASGTGVAIAVYLAQLQRLHVTWRWQRFSSYIDAGIRAIQTGQKHCLQQWQRLWTTANRPLTLALLTGLGSILFLGSLGRILQATHSWILAMVVAAQTGAIAIMGAILWRQGRSHPPDQTTPQPPTPSLQAIDYTATQGTNPPTQWSPSLWGELASPHPPTRLIAIYRVMEWGQTCRTSGSSLPTATMHQLMTSLRLMLTHETHPALQQAIKEVLMVLQK
ncbi:MAG: hypothetical protein VKJ64_14690 [Leptolyngbyaceae bacterium]|nr:hypothetical protein [Leptolyngbyaceae bacterium]